MQAPLNNIIVEIDKKWIKNMTDIMRMAEINPNSKLNPADLVNIMGTVVSVPRKIQDRMDYNGFSVKDIEIGDTLIFSYDVVFSFTKQDISEEPVYKNEFFYKGKSYWKVDIQKAFAVIRDSKIIILNGYIMVENTTEATNIFLPASMKRIKEAHTATITHIGRNLTHLQDSGAMPLDTIFFKPGLAQEYQVNGKKFWILRQRDIYGKCEPNYVNQDN